MSFRALVINKDSLYQDLVALRHEKVVLYNDQIGTNEIELTYDIIRSIKNGGFLYEGEVYTLDNITDVYIYLENQ